MRGARKEDYAGKSNLKVSDRGLSSQPTHSTRYLHWQIMGLPLEPVGPSHVSDLVSYLAKSETSYVTGERVTLALFPAMSTHCFDFQFVRWQGSHTVSMEGWF